MTALFGPYFFGSSTKHAFENERMQQFMHSKNQHFDLILLEEVMHDGYLMFGHKFKAPVAMICKSFCNFVSSTEISEFFLIFYTFFDSYLRSFWCNRQL